MSRVGIITDSIHGLSPELVRKYDIRVAAMGVNLNGKGYRDLIDISPADFYRIFKTVNQPGTTSAATPGEFLKIYESLSETADSMIYIGVSKALTATFNTAQQARKMFIADHPEIKIELFDSKNCMGGVGFLCLEAARASEAGLSFEDVIVLLQSLTPRMKYLSVLDTLKYMIRIGRLPKNAVTEEKLNYRPMIGMTNGSGNMENFAPVESAAALDRLVDLAGKYIAPGKPVHAIIHHSEYLEEAEELKKKFTARFKCSELYTSEYSPAALVSTGLMSGVSFYS
jgi:DegV family protein with EDD domain